MPDRSLYKVGVVVSITACTSAGSSAKKLRACQVKVSEDESNVAVLTVVTAASNVREGSRIVVAPVGSTVLDASGEEIVIQKTAVGGVMSEGMLCDSRMLGWVGGADGIAAQIPDSFALGSAPPESKPRSDASSISDMSSPQIPAVDVKPLFEKKLTKEEKKKLAEEKRKAKKAAKETSSAGIEADVTE